MSFQDVVLRAQQQQQQQQRNASPRIRRSHPPSPRLPKVRVGDVIMDEAGGNVARHVVTPTRKENHRPTAATVTTSARATPSVSRDAKRYLHDDLLDDYRLHISKSSSSFKDTPTAAADSTLRGGSRSRGPAVMNSETSESRDDCDSLGEERLSILRQPRPLAPKSTFAKMTQETQQYQKLVTDLEAMLKLAGESPETDWKARILLKSAQETDQGLSDKLQVYETTLLLQNPNGLRTSQKTACIKLQRDFQRSHAALVACLTEYEARQKAEISQLGATHWTHPSLSLQGVPPLPPPSSTTSRTAVPSATATSALLAATRTSSSHRTMTANATTASDTGSSSKYEDFFERTMRQRELERMNDSMRQVNMIYHELAGLVDGQQETIDRLERDIDDSAAYTEAAADEIHCLYGRREHVLCGVMDGCVDDEDNEILMQDQAARSASSSPSSTGLRVSEVFHWYMPFETIQEDLQSVKNDLVLVGKDIVSQGKRLQCTSPKSSTM